ncbi:MAG: SUMF1/EgtB/PvdO family nonheme iron enzyme [Verrucomicrobiales bacterium]|nr:SUMF1/EgtB/PvdO family nonheme iron enzyme [Verrucomicrobiales bacterium]MCP5557975.1 SUMF1/EgtB/PvdO family nonheme iron enzyme [Verrucomicrobiaceae bacterium]
MKLVSARRFLLSSTLSALLAINVSAASRVALVIGNGTYRELSESRQLTSPVHDAQDVAAALQGMGYAVVTGGALTDASRETITTATEQFAAAARNADAAVFYYSGHGIQVGDDNYLLPSDTPKLTGLSMLKNRAVLLRDSVMVALEEAEAKTKLIILDCCRDNPFSAQLEQALAQVGKSVRTKSVGEITGYGPGFYLAFATSPGSTAADGNGARNSPFTAAMLQALPGSAAKDIDFYFRDVKALLPDDQVSWTNHSIKGSFVLVPGGSGMVPGASTTPQPPADLFAGTFAGQSWENSKGTAFRWCPPGEFWMGSSEAEKKAFARDGVTTDDETRRKVKLTRGFWLSQNEVTQGEWEAIMGTTLKEQAQKMLQDDTLYTMNGKQTTIRDFYGMKKDSDPMSLVYIESPSICMYLVSWDDAVAYCSRLTEKERAAGRIPAGWSYALPTEAQWEYACRAGTESTIYSGEMSVLGKMNAPALDSIAWYGGNSSEEYTGRGTDTKSWTEKQYPGGTAGPRRVGQKKANPWGLHDMIGNVYEWCADWYASDNTGSLTDPTGPTTGVYRMVRGGSWGSGAANCRAANRLNSEPGNRRNFLGFRPALVPSSK